MLALFSVVALVRVYTGHAAATSLHPSLSWFNPFQVPSLERARRRRAAGRVHLLGLGHRGLGERGDQGRGARPRAVRRSLSTLLLLAIYSMVTVAAQAYAGIGDKGIGLGNPDNAGDVFSVLGHAVFGTSVIGAGLTKLLILMVLSSAAASTLTTILPTARTTLSMAVFKAIPAKFERIHPRHLTPTWSTIGMGLASIVFYVVLVRLSPNVLGDTVASIGLLIAFYYGMTGFACVWFFRHDLFRSGEGLLVKGVLPLLGGLILLAAFVRAVHRLCQARLRHHVVDAARSRRTGSWAASS